MKTIGANFATDASQILLRDNSVAKSAPFFFACGFYPVDPLWVFPCERILKVWLSALVETMVRTDTLVGLL